MNDHNNENLVFSGIKSSLEDAITYERGDAIDGVRVQMLTADDPTVETVSQRFLAKNKEALHKLSE